MERLICLVIGYIFGLFQTSFIYGKLHHVDIRDYGSGNAGTTNAMRVLGRRAGVITYLGDAFKALFAGLFVRLIFHGNEDMFLLLLYTGLGVILGHNFPFYMNFRGGKGIAATSGALAALGDWKITLLAFLTFAGVTLISKYVSLASLCMVTGLFLEIVIFSQVGWLPGLAEQDRLEAYIVVLLWMIMAYGRHYENIKRLVHGTERKIGQKRKEDAAPETELTKSETL